MEYTPNAVDLKWCRHIVNFIRDGGTLAFPSTRLIYTMDHQNKTITLTNPEELADPESKETHERTRIVFREGAGYKVEEVGGGGQ